MNYLNLFFHRIYADLVTASADLYQIYYITDLYLLKGPCTELNLNVRQSNKLPCQLCKTNRFFKIRF